MCFRNSWFDEKFMHMSQEVFAKVIAHMPASVHTIMFGGMGEPLLHPHIISMISACKALGLRVEIITNGALLSDTMIMQLMNSHLDKIWISLDSLHAQDQAPIPGHPYLAQTLHHIQRLNVFRAAHGHGNAPPALSLGIAFVLCAENLAQLKDLPAFVAKYHINHVNVSHMKMENSSQASSTLYDKTINMDIGSHKAQRPIINIPHMDFDRKDVQEALGGLFAHMNFTPHMGHMPMHRRTQYCKFVEEGMVFVRSDGKVSPCMELLHNGKSALGHTNRTIHSHAFGHVADASLVDIWNSEEYTAFRAKVREFSFSPCTHCGHCQDSESNLQDCYGNTKPCCGACLWAEGLLSCP